LKTSQICSGKRDFVSTDADRILLVLTAKGECRMKMILIAAAFGLSASAAWAECASYKPVSASLGVDRTIVTASIVTPNASALSTSSAEIQKTSRLPEEKAPARDAD